jgi:hypothetical protein
MSTRPDDWEKPRGRRDHLTADEVAQLRRDFNVGVDPYEAARKLKCSSRTAYRYYGEFRGEAPTRQRDKKARLAMVTQRAQPKPATPSPMVGRFYKGSFEL